MNQSQTELSFLFEKKLAEWEQNPKRMESGYEYEKTFVEMWQSLGREVLQDSVGRLPRSRNGKKNSKPA